MFKNRSFQVKMVKDDATSPTTDTRINIDFSKIQPIFEKYVKNAVIGGVATYAAVKTIDTLSTVIVNYTNPANR
jgi:hypothetical protein